MVWTVATGIKFRGAIGNLRPSRLKFAAVKPGLAEKTTAQNKRMPAKDKASFEEPISEGPPSGDSVSRKMPSDGSQTRSATSKSNGPW
jgi:hypothetical protein